MENDDEVRKRPWADMAPDLLANIFGRLRFAEIVRTVPLVCKPWQVASLDPLCYVSIDLEHDLLHRDLVERLIIPRSQGGLRHIFISDAVLMRAMYLLCHFFGSDALETDSLYLLADGAPLLETLHIPRCSVDDKWAQYAAPKMPHIVDLNLSLCHGNLSHVAIEAFGKSCKHVLKLRRNRSDWDCIGGINDAEALVIAQYYPFLKHLELQRNPLSEEGLKAILHCCPDLEHLDLLGCKHLLYMDTDLLDQCHAKIKYFYEPRIHEDDLVSPLLELDDDFSYDFGVHDQHFVEYDLDKYFQWIYSL